jgi:hypothetical protein
MLRIATCLLLLPCFLSAQRFGGTPVSLKWKQINTDSARIIFPERLDSQAQRVASVVHYLAANQPAALGKRVDKINIVLQNQTIISNGYVGLGPYRSEFYLTPAPNNFQMGSVSWGDQLALHEYRHVQQFNNFHNGLSNVMYYLFGEEGYALGINASIPDWFYEGDAVYNETLLTKQGRGRLPLFMNAYPSLWQAGKNYSWMKLRNGSLKDYVPDHYSLGYLLVNYGREKYGLDFWSKVTKDASAFKGLFYPFQRAVKKHAGINYETFRKEARDYYKNAEATKTDPAKPGPFPVVPLNLKVVNSYFFPYAVSEDSLVYLKTAYNKRPAFYIRDSKGEHLLRVRDIAVEEQFSYRNGKIVYAAYEKDPRWHWRDYSVIKLLDIHTGRQKAITTRSKYFSPDISGSSKKIAAVFVSTEGKSELHVLETATGLIQNAIQSPDITVFTDPKFVNEDSLVCAVRLRDGKMALAIANLQTGSLVRLTPPSFNVAGFPCVNDRIIYFTASYGGNDDVFAIKPGDSSIYRITSGPLGNYFVNVNHGKMTWSTFTADGYQLQQVMEKDMEWKPVPGAITENQVVAYPVSQSDAVKPLIPGDLPARQFTTDKYRKGTRLLNFHSWRPYYEDPEFSFSLYGENVLNTMQTELYYLYNENERTNAAGFSTVFGGWFPYLSAGTQYTFDRKQVVANRLRQWDQLDSRVGLSVPLHWVAGQTDRQFNIGTNYFYRNEFNKGFFKDSLGNTNFSYLQHFVAWSQQVQSAVQHIFPRLGYAVSLQYQHAITKYLSRQLLARASVYLPGLAPSHSIVATGAWQETGIVDVKFPDRFPYSRGYNSRYFSRMWRVSGNYHFPVAYPDWGFANIFYLQRIRGNVFFDFTKVYNLQKRPFADQRAVGGEIYFDTKWWNQHPLAFGVRMSYLLDTDFLSGRRHAGIVEFILPVSIIPR